MTVQVVLVVLLVGVLFVLKKLVCPKRRVKTPESAKNLGEQGSGLARPKVGYTSNLTEEERALYFRLDRLFEGVPVGGGGQEWKTASVDELVDLFRKVAKLVVKARLGTCTEEEVFADLRYRCRSLADWMEENRHRRFYMDSDMTYLIGPPRAVADRI